MGQVSPLPPTLLHFYTFPLFHALSTRLKHFTGVDWSDRIGSTWSKWSPSASRTWNLDYPASIAHGTLGRISANPYDNVFKIQALNPTGSHINRERKVDAEPWQRPDPPESASPSFPSTYPLGSAISFMQVVHRIPKGVQVCALLKSTLVPHSSDHQASIAL